MNLEDQQLVAAAFEGGLDEAGFRRLQDRLRDEPALLAHYREQALLHHSLCEEFEGRRMMGDEVPRPAAGSRKTVLLVAAALLAGIAAAGWIWTRGEKAPSAASCEFSADAIATVDGRAVSGDGPRLVPGSRLAVERGWVRLKGPGDAVTLIGAPAAVMVGSDRTLHLESGRVRLRIPEGGAGFTVTTGLLQASGTAADFGVWNRPGVSAEVHAFAGTVEVTTAPGTAGERLAAGEALAVAVGGEIRRMPALDDEFESFEPGSRLLLEDRFDSDGAFADRRPDFGDSHWRLEKGMPELKGEHLEGSGFEAYFSLPAGSLSSARPVLLATMETVETPGFHSDGWAGFSLYQDGYEICFFGDSFGPERTWSLDVKRSLYPQMPDSYVTGARTMTLRYDRRDGAIEVHEGDEPGGDPLVRSKILPGLTFDQIRIGASPGASLGLSRLTVRAVGGSPAR